MICPKCQANECWDNDSPQAKFKRKPGQPRFVCRDKEGCGWKGDNALSGEPAPVAVARAAPLSLMRGDAAPVVAPARGDYWALFDGTVVELKTRYETGRLAFGGEPIPMSLGEIAQIVATRFIQANK